MSDRFLSPAVNTANECVFHAGRTFSIDGVKEVISPARVTYMIDHLYNIEGGGEQALLRIIRHLPRKRFRPSVVTFRIKPRSKEILYELDCPVHVFPVRRTYGWSGFNAALSILSLFRAEKPDIVHTFFETSNTWGGLITKLSFGPLLVSSRRDMGFLRSRKHRFAYKLINRLSDGIQTVSKEVAKMCVENEGINPEKVVTVYNGVDITKADRVDECRAAEMRTALGAASHIVVTVASIKPIKGLDTLLKTADIVRRKVKSALFVIAGYCPEKQHFEELQQTIKELDLGSTVRFLGPLEDVFPLLRISDLFCLLSRSEGFSNALLEAMACQLPCVVTEVGGNPEAVKDGVSGLLVPPNDAAAAADGIIKLLEQSEYAKEMGRKARQTVESNFTANNMVDHLAEFYERLLESRRLSTKDTV